MWAWRRGMEAPREEPTGLPPDPPPMGSCPPHPKTQRWTILQAGCPGAHPRPLPASGHLCGIPEIMPLLQGGRSGKWGHSTRPLCSCLCGPPPHASHSARPQTRVWSPHVVEHKGLLPPSTLLLTVPKAWLPPLPSSLPTSPVRSTNSSSASPSRLSVSLQCFTVTLTQERG